MKRDNPGSLWQQSRNFRRLGYIVFCLALLLLSSRFFTSGQQAPVSSTSPPAQYQAAAGNLAPAAVSPASVPLAAATISEQPLELPPNAKGLGTAETGNVPPHLPTLQNIVASADLGELAQYPPLQDPWGDTLNPGGGVPNRGYDTYYLDANEPDRPYLRRNHPFPAIWHNQSSYLNIPSENFAVYWIGRLEVPQTARYQFGVVQRGQGQARVSIDRRVIKKSDDAGIPDIELRRGSHIVEIEFLNNEAAQIGFYLTTRPTMPLYTAQNLADALKALNLPADTVVYAAITEYVDINSRSELHISADQRPYILFLPVGPRNWDIRTDNNPPQAVILYHKPSTIQIDGKEPPLLQWDQGIPYAALARLHDGTPDCYCTATSGTFKCNRGGFDDLGTFAAQVRTWTGYPLAGISFGRSHYHTTVPEIAVTRTNIEKSRRLSAQQMAEMREACRSTGSKGQRDVNTLMKGSKS